MQTQDAFLAMVAHELMSPITSLCLSTELLSSEFDFAAETDLQNVRWLIEKVGVQSVKLANLVTYLLDVLRSESGWVPLAGRETDLVELAEAVAADAQARTTRHQIRVSAPSPVWAVVDSARIEQVLLNLLDNALKYSPDGGPIDIELAQHTPSLASIAVRDHGVGIAPEHREHMFDRFSRSHDPKMPGMGLGLYLCRRLVEQHGGELRAEFPPDGGTRVVTLLARFPASGGLLPQASAVMP